MIVFEKVIFLRKMPLFKNMKEEALLVFAANVEEQTAEEGETIIHKGDLGDAMFMIVKGKVKVHDGEREVAQIGEGEVVGELAALLPDRRIASVTAVEDSFFFKISHLKLYELMETNMELVRGIIAVLIQRLREIESRVSSR